MSKQVIGIPAFGSVEVEVGTTGGFEGFPERVIVSIEAVSPRLIGMVSGIQQTTYDLDRSREIRSLCEARVTEKLGLESGADFIWG